MHITKQFHQSSWSPLFLSLGALLTLYGHLIFEKKLVKIDYVLVVEKLKNIKNINHYFESLFAGSLSDFQPIRDLSHLIDIPFEFLFSGNLFLLNNFLIWSLSSWVFISILKKLEINKNVRLFIWLCFITHPILSEVLPWIMARKHLLSSLFFLLMLNELLNQTSKKWKLILFYILSVLSQPISVLAPLLLFSTNKTLKEKKEITLILVPTMIIAIMGNYYFYNNLFFEQQGVHKFIEQKELSYSLMQFGRSFYQILIPFFPAFDYRPYSIENFFGLILLTLSLIGVYLTKKLNQSQKILVTTLFFFPLLIVFTKTTSLFIQNTYLVIPLTGFLITIGFILNRLKQLPWPIYFIPLILSLSSYLESTKWKNYKTFWKSSYSREPSCINSTWHAQNLWSQKEIKEALEVSRKIIKRRCAYQSRSYRVAGANIYINSIVFDDSLTKDKKLRLIEKVNLSSNTKKFLKLIINYNKNKKEEILELAKELNIKRENILLDRVN